MKVLHLAPLCLLLCLAGCGDTTTIVQYSPTLGPISFLTNTPVAQSVQMGTGLSGQTITHPTTLFTATDTLAFVVTLPAPTNASQALVAISDPAGFPVLNQTIPVDPLSRDILAQIGPLGQVLKEPPGFSPPARGTYRFMVFLYPPPFYTDYANAAPFTYTP